jgi:hypothetical protein
VHWLGIYGGVWGEVKDGASKHKSSTECVQLESIGDVAGVGKNNWGEAGCMWEAGARRNKGGQDTCLPTPLVGVLHLVMAWGRNCQWGACLGCCSWAGRHVGGQSKKKCVGAEHLPADAIGRHDALGNGLVQKSPTESAIWMR